MSIRTGQSKRYLIFSLGQQSFALEITKVREVMYCTNITQVPRTPEYLTGVINLRGNVVPVIDLRRKLGMDVTDYTINTCIIIMEIASGDEGHQLIGGLADSVQEVVELYKHQIGAPPKLGTNLNAEFIHGMAKHEESFISILDMEEVLSYKDGKSKLIESENQIEEMIEELENQNPEEKKEEKEEKIALPEESSDEEEDSSKKKTENIVVEKILDENFPIESDWEVDEKAFLEEEGLQTKYEKEGIEVLSHQNESILESFSGAKNEGIEIDLEESDELNSENEMDLDEDDKLSSKTNMSLEEKHEVYSEESEIHLAEGEFTANDKLGTKKVQEYRECLAFSEKPLENLENSQNEEDLLQEELENMQEDLIQEGLEDYKESETFENQESTYNLQQEIKDFIQHSKVISKEEEGKKKNTFDENQEKKKEKPIRRAMNWFKRHI